MRRRGETKEVVRVSEISIYLTCPRQVYFLSKNENKMFLMGEEAFLEELILKEVAHLLPTAKNEGKYQDVEKMLDVVLEYLPIVYREELEDMDESRLSALLERKKGEIISELKETGWWKKVTRDDRFFRCDYKREYTIFSEKLGLSGSVEKLMRIDGKLTPCIIRTGRCPDRDVWYRDRIQLAAYAILSEEEFGEVVDHGLVEYIREGEIRDVMIRRKDRLKSLQILRNIRRIKRGLFPEKGERAPCESCMFEETCNIKGKSLLSKIFG